MADATPATIRLLHLDDDPMFLDVLERVFEREFDHFEVLSATDPEEGLAVLERERVDCVVSDYDMPARNGLDFLDAVRAERPRLPFVLFTGKGPEEIAVGFRAEHADGSWRDLDVRGRNLLDDPLIEGIVISAHDVTPEGEDAAWD